MKNPIEKLSADLTAKGFYNERAYLGTSEVISKNGETIPECYKELCFVCFVYYEAPEKYNKNPAARTNEFLKLMKRKRDLVIYRVMDIYGGRQYAIATPADAETLRKDAELKKIVLNDFWKDYSAKRAKAANA